MSSDLTIMRQIVLRGFILIDSKSGRRNALSFLDNILVNQWISRMWFPNPRLYFYRKMGLIFGEESTIHRNIIWLRPDNKTLSPDVSNQRFSAGAIFQ
jgi:hypothetical protein